MERRTLLALSIWLFAAAAFPAAERGALVVVGGGATDDAVVARAIELGGGSGAAIVAVLPQASEVPETGSESAAQWKKAGAADAIVVDFGDRAAARHALETATLIWMPGGDQNRFMQAIAGTGLDDLIRARHAAGVTVGGTSAGAAILSRVMITGEADLKSVTAGATVTAPGLGLWPDVIVDQHFLTRQRMNRLISAVLDHPTLVGVGIDESTAAIVRGSRVDVVGKSAVVVIDARGVATQDTRRAVAAGIGLALHVLRSGMTIDLARVP